MHNTSLSATRRNVFTAAAVAGAVSLGGMPLSALAAGQSIRLFRVAMPASAVADMKRRVASTFWPDAEPVADSQSVPLAWLQPLLRYWASGYDWRKFEARLNALPMFLKEIDGLDIHFIHVRSRHENALPDGLPSL